MAKAARAPERERAADDGEEVAAPKTRGLASALRVIFAPMWTIDPRALAIVRIALGLDIIFDLFHRIRWWFVLYGDDGIDPRTLPHSRFVPSLFAAIGSHTALVFLWFGMLAVYVLFTLGLFTRVAHTLTLLLWIGTINRIQTAGNGGYTLMLQFLVWSSFLRLGDRYSLDALRRSLARRPNEQVTSLAKRGRFVDAPRVVRSPAVAVLYLELVAMYGLGALLKTGPTWRVNYTAVYYALHDDQYVTPLSDLIRDRMPLWLVHVLTFATVFAESTLPLAILAGTAWMRRYALASLLLLHLIFGLTMQLGPFAWGCSAVGLLLLRPEDLDATARALRRVRRARVVLVDHDDAGAWLLARALARLDRLDLIRFEEATGAAPFTVRDASGVEVTGRAALAAAVAALPFGPIVAWLVALPVVGDAVFALAPRLLAVLVRLPMERWPREGPVRSVLRLAAYSMFSFLLVLAVFQLRLAREPHAWRPSIIATVGDTFKLSQNWRFFSPDPPKYSRVMNIDVLTADGRHVDPVMGVPARHELLHPSPYPQFIRDTLQPTKPSGAKLQALANFARRYGERTGRPGDHVVSGSIYSLVQLERPIDHSEMLPVVETVYATFAEHGRIVRPAPTPSAAPTEEAPPALEQGL
ncbi:MAG TPA: hypothetical protein VGM56_01065 [Byssovorax sp.]|jgi:hypothetical protein